MGSDPDHGREAFAAMLARGPVLLSGGFGTELHRRGVDTRLPLWAAAANVDVPDAVRRLHLDYLEAGARVLTANTFRTDPHAAAASGRNVDAAELTRTAVRLACEAVETWLGASGEGPVLVAGSVGPVRECYAPADVPADDVLAAEHGERIDALVEAACDLVMVETMNTIREAVAALRALDGRLPAVVSFVCRPGGCLLSGEPLAEAAAAVEPFEPLALGVNCCAPAVATEALEALLLATDRPVGVHANGEGRPEGARGWTFEGGVDDAAYVEAASGWLDRGARLVGGCCGTSPATIRAVAGGLRRRRATGGR